MPQKRRNTAICFATILILFIAGFIWVYSIGASAQKKVDEINSAIAEKDYTTAKQLIDEAENEGINSTGFLYAKLDFYQNQGMNDSAADELIKYCGKVENKADISESLVERINKIRTVCSEETSAELTLITEKIAAQKAEVEAQKKEQKRAKEIEKAEKEAEKKAKEEAKEKEKAEKEAAKKAEKEAKKRKKAAAEKSEKKAKTEKKQTSSTSKKTSKNEKGPSSSATSSVTKAQKGITTSKQAISRLKKYELSEGYSDPHDKFSATDDGDKFIILAGYSYNGDSWESSADLYHVDKKTQSVKPMGNIESNMQSQEKEQLKFRSKQYKANGVYVYDLKYTDGFLGGDISGYVKNETNSRKSIVISFAFFDENGVQLSTTNKLIEYLAPGSVAAVSIYDFPYKMVDYEIVEIQTY